MNIGLPAILFQMAHQIPGRLTVPIAGNMAHFKKNDAV